MRNKLSSIIGQRLPEYLRFGEQGNNFELFLKAYYEFLEKKLGATGLVNNHLEYVDIDHTLDEFINNFFKEFGEYIPQKTAHDKRLILKKLYTLYKTKGTEPAVRLFFKMVYGVIPEVQAQTFLKASDGRWEQLLCIRVVVSDDVKIDTILQREVQWDNKAGLQSAIIQNVRKIKTGIYDVFFLNTSAYLADIGDSVTFLDIDGSTLYTGFIRPIPKNISVSKAGKGYRVGQIFRLSAPDRDSIVRVKEVGLDSSLKKLEFIDIGGNYTGSRSYIISPYNPLLDVPFRLFLDENNNPVVELRDKLNGFVEEISISKDTNSFDPNGYFAEQYIEDQPYNTLEALSYTEDTKVNSATSSFDFDLSITEQIYQESLSLITLNVDGISKYPGRFVNDDGHVSSASIKLQDSLLYQKFSYVLESPILLKEYKEAFIKLIHPAGYKLFSRLKLDVKADFTSLLAIHIQRDMNVTLSDSAGIRDNVFKHITLPKSDAVTNTELILKSITAPKTDSLTSADTVLKSIQSNKTESLTSSDVITSFVISKNIFDTIITSDLLLTERTRILEDTVNAFDLSLEYDAENYFAELYNEVPYELVTKNLNNSLLDSGTAIDLAGISLFRSFSDTQAVSDLLAISFTAPKTDTTTTADSVTNSPNKTAVSIVTTADVATFNINGSLNDSVVTTDDKSFSTQDSLLDTANANDVFARSATFNREFASTATTIDTVSINAPTAYSDTVAVTDSLLISRQINLSDTVITNDIITNTTISKQIDDSSSTNDVINRTLTGEDYSDQRTYFAEQYAEYSTFPV